MVKERLPQVRVILQAVFGPRFHRVVLYGSEARNEGSPDSDIDLLVLLDGPINLGDDLRAIIDALYPMQLEIIRPLHALPVDIKDYESGAVALYRQAQKEGIAA